MKKIILAILATFAVSGAYACTSAIVSGKNTVNGRPLLWKHRDTGEENNILILLYSDGGVLTK